MIRPPAALLVVVLAAGPVLAQGHAPRERLTDAQAEALARSALGAPDEKTQRSVLAQLDAHHFKSSFAPERETVLFVQGLLQDKLGDVPRAALTFHKLEAAWPQSAYLGEAQAVMAQAALERGRFKEAESRLNRALGAEIPAETVRRCQELLLWCLADQGRASEGIATVKALQPLGTARPSEKGMVGIMEALCAAEKRSEAEGTLADYHKLYPAGAYGARMDLDWGKLLGTTGDTRNAAKVFQKLIQEKPAAPEADEARMALATLLADGSLPPKDAEGYPDAQALLARVKKTGTRVDTTRRTHVINLRIALKERKWVAALDAVAQFRATRPSPGEAKPVTDLRGDAVRGLAQEALDRKDPLRLLPYLDTEGLMALTPPLRLGLVRSLAEKGLPDASRALIRTAPASEQSGLSKAALEGLNPGSDAPSILALLPAKGETPQESLLRAQAALSLHRWAEARAALPKARPGPARIQALLAYLRRPLDEGERPEARSRDIDAWLAKAPEKGEEREPLLLLAADHKARQSEWRAALALYPATPSPANRGWVALMRATCLARLGQADSARAALREAGEAADFKTERISLEKRLSM